jgi:hypothetical protein
MPIYLFKNPKTGFIAQVFQVMNDKHIYSENGIEFERIFTAPNAQIDSQIDPNSSVQFIEKTGKMKGTMGEIWDYSKELSEKRAKSNGGEDPIRAKAEKKYSNKRKGIKYKEKINSSEMPTIQLD